MGSSLDSPLCPRDVAQCLANRKCLSVVFTSPANELLDWRANEKARNVGWQSTTSSFCLPSSSSFLPHSVVRLLLSSFLSLALPPQITDFFVILLYWINGIFFLNVLHYAFPLVLHICPQWKANWINPYSQLIFPKIRFRIWFFLMLSGQLCSLSCIDGGKWFSDLKNQRA